MNNQKFSLKLNSTMLSADNFFIVCLSGFSLFALAIKKWMTVSLFITCLISLYILFINKKNGWDIFPKNNSKNWLLWISTVLAFPLIAVLLGQLFRQKFYAADYDNVYRFILTIPILYTITSNKINSLKYLEYAIPTAIFITLFSILLNPNKDWGEDRLTTYFVDPILFGSISVTLALMSLISINLYQNDNLYFKLFKLAGFLIGIYLSIISGSRTGWAAIPIVLLLWIYIKFSGKNFLIALIALLIFIASLLFVPVVQQRIHLAINEVLSYQWSHVSPDTSIGLRITFIRIGFFLFSHNIFSGLGNNGFKEMLNAVELARFTTASARETCSIAGFHNEIIANMVKSGIWGLISSLLLFLFPFYFFMKGLCSKLIIIRHHALVAISYLICVFISGMTIEVFSSKLTVSFHAMMLVNLSGSLWVIMHSEQKLQNL